MKLAFDPDLDRDAKHASVLFVPVRTPDAQALTFRQAADDPARARKAFAAWHAVTIRTGNNRTSPGRYLARYDRRQAPHASRIELTIWNAATDIICSAVWVGTADCRQINELAHSAAPLDEDGFVVQHLGRNPQYIRYIIPARERVSATGEAIYFQCGVVLKGCQNYLIHFFGPAIRKTVSLFYEFHLSQYPKSAFRELDGLARAIFDDVIVHAP